MSGDEDKLGEDKATEQVWDDPRITKFVVDGMSVEIDEVDGGVLIKRNGTPCIGTAWADDVLGIHILCLVGRISGLVDRVQELEARLANSKEEK